jgi:vesicle coat complex subunit
MLSASKPPVRGKALIGIYKAYDWEEKELPAEVIEHCWDMLENDRSGKVRQTAVAVLQRVGEVSYEEAMAYLEER